MKPFILSVLLAYSLQPTAYCLTDAWGVDVQQHTAVQRTYKQGETWSLQISLRDGLKPLNLTGATARWYWYTNAVDNVWWTNSASVSSPLIGQVTAAWTPAMDVGAPVYYYWLGVWPSGSTSPLWRATGTIRMLASPGFRPNAQPVPVRTLDFSAITVTNAPWVASSDWAAGSNALASAVQAHAQRTDNPHGVTPQQIGAATPSTVTTVVASAIAALPPPSTDALRLTNAGATRWIDSAGDIWQVSTTVSTTFVALAWSMQGVTAFGVPCPVTNFGQLPFMLPDWQLNPFWQLHADLGDLWNQMAITLTYDNGTGNTGMWSSMGGSEWPLTLVGDLSGNLEGTVTVTPQYSYASTTTTNRVGRLAQTNEIPVMPTNYVAGFALTIPNTNAVYQLTVDSNRVLTVWEVLP